MKDSHNSDDSLKSGVKCYDTAEKFSKAIGSDDGSQSSGNNNSNGKGKTFSFIISALSSNNCSLNESSGSYEFFLDQAIGPLVGDGAPYSAIGSVELLLLTYHIEKDVGFEFQPIPLSLNGHTHWQYGVSDHSSAFSSNIGSVVITAISDSGRKVLIHHFVLDGSSQGVIGKNVTKESNILKINRNALQFHA